MDTVQSFISKVLYPEEDDTNNNTGHHQIPGTPTTHEACVIRDCFVEDIFNRNLRIDTLELEVRLGKAPHVEAGRRAGGCFTASVPEATFSTYISALQRSSHWTAPPVYERDVVAYFDDIDDSVRLHIASDGQKRLLSKQKVGVVDVRVLNAPHDFRIAASIEVPMDNARTRIFTTQRASRTVVRDRSSFTYQNFRYDLTRLTDAAGGRSHMVEIELVDPSGIQLKGVDAKALTAEVHQRVVDLFSIIEPIERLQAQVVRTRWF